MTAPPSEPSAAQLLPVATATSSWRSPDGAAITIRPTCPADASMAQRFVRELSPEARYFRFLGTVRELTPQRLQRFVHIDHAREVALVALISRGGRDRQLGECRYAVHPGGDSCEFALAVLDEWQRRGLGERLLSELIGIARTHGLRSMVGDVFASNAAMLRLALKLGFDVSVSTEEWSLRRVSLALWPAPRMRSDAESAGPTMQPCASRARWCTSASFTA